MRRFFETATVVKVGEGYLVSLDGREVKTPEKRQNLSPTKAMADAICAEWNAQGDKINPADMLIAKLQNTAIDRVETRRDDLIDELVKYAGNDLICYRAEFPEDLAMRHDVIWQPLLNRIKTSYSITLKITKGIIPIDQDMAELAKIRAILESLDSFKLAAFYNITTLCGSVAIALNVLGGHISVDQAWDAAQLDENFQIEQWGTDDEATLRHNNMKAELDSAVRFLGLCEE